MDLMKKFLTIRFSNFLGKVVVKLYITRNAE